MWNVAQGLAAAPEFDVQALSLTNETTDPQKFGRLTLYPVAPAVAVRPQAGWLKRRLALVKYFGNLLRALIRQRADIYFSKLASREASVVFLASRIVGAKYIFRVEHDWETNLNDLRENIFGNSRFAPRVFIFCLKRADLVVAQTQKQVDALKESYNIDSVIIPNGHVIPDSDGIGHDPEQRKSVVWIGRAHPMKRPMLFLDLAERHYNQEFTMIMAPSDEHPELLEQTRLRAESLSNVNFLPGVSAAEINRYLETARLFVLTSEAEGFSNVIIEALKNGVPALSLGHNPNDLLQILTSEGIPTAGPGFYAADSMESCSKLLQLMSNDAEFWGQCHLHALTFARDMFGLETVLQQYRNHFFKLSGKL